MTTSMDEIIEQAVTKAMITALGTAIQLCQQLALPLSGEEFRGAMKCVEALAGVKAQFEAAVAKPKARGAPDA